MQLNVTAGASEQYSGISNQELIIGIVPEYPISDEGTLTVCTGTFYDSGLDVGEYDNDEDYTMTFLTPGGEDYVVIEFVEFETESGYDELEIFDGPDTGSPSLGIFDGTNSPGTIMGANGLTFNFISDVSNTDIGWIANVSCYTASEPPDCAENPVPANAATDVFPANLTWDASLGATSYDVYFGTDPDPYANTAENILSTTYTVTVDPNTTYFWAVIPINDIGPATNCDAWEFTTSDPVYIMTNGTATTCAGVFYDDGGADGEYSNNANIIMTFYPETSGTMLNFVFSEFSVEDMSSGGCYDQLNVYNGTSTSADLIGEYCDDNPLDEVIASNNDGALTFEFISDGSVTQDGWTAVISCVTVNTYTITFRVTDGINPIEEAAVDFNGSVINTDVTGLAIFEEQTQATDVAYTISKDSYSDVVGTVDIDDNKTVDIVMNLIAVIGNLKHNISIYPNPTTNILNIEIPNISETANVTVTDIAGRILYKAAINKQITTVDFSNRAKGIYILKLTIGSEIFNKKIVVE